MSERNNKEEPERVPLEETGDEKIAGEAVMLMSNKESNYPQDTEAEEADNNNVHIPIAEEEMKEEPKIERENDTDATEDDDEEENDDEEEEEEEEEESNSKAYDDLKKSENCQTISIVNKVEKHESNMVDDNNEDGTEEEQAAFMKELENFHKEMVLEFKPPKFYGEGLNCLKLWRAVTKLGGYDQVTACKLWRQVGESFNPPKTCTTISWSFRCFYEKALLEYEKHKIRMGDLEFSIPSLGEPTSLVNMPKIATQSSGSGRTIRDAAARAMQGWHSQRFHGNGEISDPIIKDKKSVSLAKHDKQHKTSGIIKRKKVPSFERFARPTRPKITTDSEMDTVVDDFGPPADWVKINVLKTKDCFEVYALVPGLLREEVRVQSDPGGRLVISGEPEHLDNPWGVTPFKKIITLPSRIDPYKTSAVVTLHGQLFVRVPFEPSDL